MANIPVLRALSVSLLEDLAWRLRSKPILPPLVRYLPLHHYMWAVCTKCGRARQRDVQEEVPGCVLREACRKCGSTLEFKVPERQPSSA